jgi:hypothetical protein
VQAAGAGRRSHLGASEIGEECLRRLWYSFRWCTEPAFDGRMLRLFERGRLEEPRVVAELRAVGVEVHEVDPDTGQQFRFAQHGGHYGGSMDGVARGLPEAPKTWHVLEFKTASAKRWRELERKGVEKAQPKHAAQMQAYMHELGLKRAAYIATNKDDEALYMERVRYDEATGERLRQKALRVIQAPEPLERIADDGSKWPCTWCDAKGACHQGRVPPVTCRTCVHATPELDGHERWTCARFGKDLSRAAQELACDEHVFIPALLEAHGTPVDATDESVIYERADGERWANTATSDFTAAPAYTSQELRDATLAVMAEKEAS